jgi:hypothetical protein
MGVEKGSIVSVNLIDAGRNENNPLRMGEK